MKLNQLTKAVELQQKIATLNREIESWKWATGFAGTIELKKTGSHSSLVAFTNLIDFPQVKKDVLEQLGKEVINLQNQFDNL